MKYFSYLKDPAFWVCGIIVTITGLIAYRKLVVGKVPGAPAV